MMIFTAAAHFRELAETGDDEGRVCVARLWEGGQGQVLRVQGLALLC